MRTFSRISFGLSLDVLNRLEKQYHRVFAGMTCLYGKKRRIKSVVGGRPDLPVCGESEQDEGDEVWKSGNGKTSAFLLDLL